MIVQISDKTPLCVSLEYLSFCVRFTDFFSPQKKNTHTPNLLALQKQKFLWMGAESSHQQFQQQQAQQQPRNLAKARRSICVTSSAPPTAAMLNVTTATAAAAAIDHRRHSTMSYLGVMN